jgi:hypothetical protein
MPRYRLLSAHYSEENKWLPGDKEMSDQGEEKGTIVGDGTPHLWTRDPTPDMVGLDPESEKLVAKARKRGDGLNPVDYLPLTTGGPTSIEELEAVAERMGYRLEKEDA